MEVCRAITFMNYFIPMSGKVDIPYVTIGFFDGMLTEKIDVQDVSAELRNLWKYSLKRTAKGTGQYSHQNIFCFSKDEWNQCTDEMIWQETTEQQFPLTFVVFLQLTEYLDGDDAIAGQCRAFNKELQSVIGKEGLFYTYGTVDKNDFVVCIKCRSYILAVNAIKRLHKTGKEVVYSYSVFSVSRKMLETLNEDEYGDIYREEIKSICLKGITNSFNPTNEVTLDQKYYEFCEELVGRLYGDGKKAADYVVYDILGDDDFRLIARNVKLGLLLKQFSEKGIFRDRDRRIRFYLFSSSLVLNTKTPANMPIEETYIQDNLLKMENSFQTPMCSKLQDKMSRIAEEIARQEHQNIENEKVATFCSAIWQLLQSLKALETPTTKKYDFWSLYYPLSMLAEILEERMKKSCEDQKKQKNCELGEREEIFDFIHKISMTLHGTLRTDIQFFQIRDFNAIVHYAPAKLRAFYALWVLQLSDYYNEFCDVKNSYSFVFSPGMFSKVSIKELFTDYAATKRLMLITLPERHLYTPKWLAVVLAHEVSHFVGYKVRNREKRHFAWLKGCARILYLEWNHLRYHVCEKEWKNVLETELPKSDLYTRLVEYLLEEEQQVRKKAKLWPHEFHSKNSMIIIQETFQKVAQNSLEKLIGDDCEKMNRRLKQSNEFQALPLGERVETIHRLSYKPERAMLFLYQKYQGILPQILGILRYIMVEACADINAILTLELMPMEYILSFCRTEKYFQSGDIQDEKAMLLIVRQSLVIQTIQQKIESSQKCFVRKEFVKQWSECNVGKYALSFPNNSVEEKIALGIYSYLTGQKDYGQSIRHYESLYNYSSAVANFQFEILDFLNDSEIRALMQEYTGECMRKYVEVYQTKDSLQQQKICLLNTYLKLSGGSPVELMQEIEKFLKKFEEKQFL